MRLSGGQTKNSHCPSTLRKAPIILDEAAASVDVETEKEIQKAIADLSGRKQL